MAPARAKPGIGSPPSPNIQAAVFHPRSNSARSANQANPELSSNKSMSRPIANSSMRKAPVASPVAARVPPDQRLNAMASTAASAA